MTALDRQRELLAKATPGPWRQAVIGPWDVYPADARGTPPAICRGRREADAALIVAAVNDRAALLAVVEATEAVAHDWYSGVPPEAMATPFDALRAALDRLHAEEGWHERH